MIRKRTNLKRQGKCILRGVLLCTLNKNSDAVSGSQLLFRHGCVCHCVCVRMCVCVYPLLGLLKGWERAPPNTCPAAWLNKKSPLNCLWKKKKKKTTNKLIIIFKLHQSRRVYYSVCVCVWWAFTCRSLSSWWNTWSTRPTAHAKQSAVLERPQATNLVPVSFSVSHFSQSTIHFTAKHCCSILLNNWGQWGLEPDHTFRV